MLDLAGRPYTIEFPMDDGSTLLITHDGQQLTRPAYTYAADGFATHHNAACLLEPKFQEAYQLGANSGHTLLPPGQQLHVEWRVHQYIWAAWHCKQLEGDFVECGVNTGIFSLAIMKYLDWNTIDKDFWLFDTYEGCPAGQFTQDEVEIGIDKVHENSYFDCFELAKRNFSPWERAKLVKGRVPESLSTVEIDKVAYIMIDMNAVVPEIAAAEYFWPKMVSGAIMCLDDYNWVHHIHQKIAFDKFAEERGVKILNLPSGQGILMKP
jgi:O-methyltransferase